MDDDTTGDDAPGESTYPTFRVMSVSSVLYDLGDASPQIHLMETEAPYRHLTIAVALVDAQALHHAMTGVKGVRPTTHELASSIIARLQADIIAARIVRHDDGVFYAELDLMTPRGRQRLDCRTSDALVLALRQAVPAPILCDDDVLASFYR